MVEDASAGAKRSPPGDDKSSVRASDQSELVDEMRDRVAYLERQVEEEREARRRADTILAQLSQANTELSRTIRTIETPASEATAAFSQEPSGATEQPGRVEPQPAVGGAQEGSERASWWRRMFGR